MYIGIDLGTSNSAIAGIIDGEARVFHPADGGEVLPSAIYIDKRGHKLYGRRAYDQALIAPENAASGFKRLMGTSTQIDIKGAGVSLSAEECSAEIIRQLLGQAATESGTDEVSGAIITVPAAFNQMQSEATLRAAKAAGLEKVDLLQEPVAAALAAMAGAKRSGQFLVYDLGGGTFDVALVQAINGEVSIIAQQGINMLGGRDFDRMIVNEIVRPWLLANFDLSDDFQRDPQYARLIRIAQVAAEKAKIDLSSLEESSIFAPDDEVRLMDQSETEIFLDAPITRAQFEALIREPVMQTISMILNMLEENNYSREDIDRIVFIGGPSRTPLVRQLVSEELGIAADLKTDPMTAVALGAAYYCESRKWNESSPLPMAGGSEPKEIHATSSTPQQPNIQLNYDQRTPEDKVKVIVNVEGVLNETRQIKFSSEDWDSGILPLASSVEVVLPLNNLGLNKFNVEVFEGNGEHIDIHDQTISITRVVATAKSVPASHTVAVKALQHAHARENVLLPLFNKGTPLPASGQAKFRSGYTLESGGVGSISFELFQVEYPERVELNLCIGLFRINGNDLPEGQEIKAGDPIIFDWRMSEGGILQASVQLPKNGLQLKVPRFYAPQAGEMSFDEETGVKFTQAVIAHGEEEWGDLTAAIGPEGGPEIQLLKTRLTEQREILEESSADAETVRRVAEETRFIRQDIARIGRKHRGQMMQRQLGKMSAVFNRVARAGATAQESSKFDELSQNVQHIIDDGDSLLFKDADLHMDEMRDMFFNIAWRNDAYVLAWFKRLSNEPYLYPDKEEFLRMTEEGQKLIATGDKDKIRELVSLMLDSRVSLGASEMASDPATIIKI